MEKYTNVVNEIQSVLYDGDTLVSLVVSPEKASGGDAIKLDIPFDPWDIDTLMKVLNKYFPDGANCEVDFYDNEYVIWLYSTDVY